MTALAWFSDVAYEVAEVTKGYRLVLTYKLAQTGSAKQSANFFAELSERSRALHLDREGQPEYVFYYMLDHQYTDTNLSLANMKGRDQVISRFLHDKCSDCGAFLLLAKVTHLKTRSDFDHEDEEKTSEYSTNLVSVYSPDGEVVGTSINADDDETLSAYFCDRDPDSTVDRGFTTYLHYRNTVRTSQVVSLNTRLPADVFSQVAIVVPKLYLGGYLHLGNVTKDAADNMVSMVVQDLERHREDRTERGAIAPP